MNRRLSASANHPRRVLRAAALVAAVWLADETMNQPGIAAGSNANQARGLETSDWAAILQRYVNDAGQVDYQGLLEQRQPLDRFVAQLGEPRPAYAGWEASRQIAFWINAYNALVLRIVIDHYPIEAGLIGGLIHPDNSIRQIDGVFDEILHPVLGRDMTLDQIEHQTLRKEFNEPRIHFALVCAARSCPRLRREPYRGDRLEVQLKDQARTFLRNSDHFQIDREASRVRMSSIFKWFGEDFIDPYRPEQGFSHLDPKEAAVLHYAGRFLAEDDAEFLRDADYQVSYLDYDWTLNEWRGR